MVGVELALLVALPGLAVTGSLAAAHYSARLVQIGPGLVAVERLQRGVLEQSSGLARYIDHREPGAIAQYASGETTTTQALGQVRTALAGGSRSALLDRVEAAVRGWHAWAERTRLDVAASGGVPDKATTDAGNRLLESFRSDVADLGRAVYADVTTAATNVRIASEVSSITTIAGSLVIGIIVVLLSIRLIRVGVDPLLELASTANRIAAGQVAEIPYVLDRDEVGQLASALLAWQEAAAERAVLGEQAPVGICRVDPTGLVSSVNRAALHILGRPASGILGLRLPDLVHPSDRAGEERALDRLREREIDRHTAEVRCAHPGGSVIWCSLTMARLEGHGDEAGQLIAIVEDITPRKRQAEQAGRIQRELLPKATLELGGYELAGDCLPAQDVAGDFYDWSITTGQVDFTVADVMGKGMPAALVMATLRAALRLIPPQLSLRERLRLAGESVAPVTEEDGSFVTMFHGRLELATGRLTYVDAGHGHCVVRKANGELVRLGIRSLPLGVAGTDEEFREGALVLEPGDMLLVHSDGLVELHDQVLDLSAFATDIAAAASAQDLVERLLGRMSGPAADDITVVALRRLPVEERGRVRASPATAAARRHGAPVRPAGAPSMGRSAMDRAAARPEAEITHFSSA